MNRSLVVYVICPKLLKSSYVVKMGMGDEEGVRDRDLVE
jgi:hypothetical protein